MKIATIKGNYFTVGIAILGFLGACGNPATEQKEKPESPQPSLNLTTDSLRLMQPSYSLSLPAELKPYEQVQVYAKVNGFVQKLLVDRGAYVRKNQLLAILEAPEMGQQYLSDKAGQEKMNSDYNFAQQAYERLKEASSTEGAVSPIELDRAKSMMLSAKSAYEASKAGTAHTGQLQSYLRILAPFDGIITERNSSVGALVGPGSNQSLFSIAQSQKLRLTLSIPEKHAASISDAMSASFSVSSLPGEIFTAKLSRSSGTLDAQHRSLVLEFDVDNSQHKLQGGEYAQVKLNLQRKAASFWVSPKQIVNASSGPFVMTLKENSLQRVAVKEGIRVDSLQEIFGDLDPADLILKHPSEEIKEGKLN